ncbi:MAG: hypothetical protein M3N53_10605 [Actinomycetota bacterium]|nr:hypothetical protein [Actinomycetota bacterium]
MGERLVTAVIGAGPAGLLFCSAASIMFEGRGGHRGTWPILLFDKRMTYERTHRLRMAAAPLLDLQRDLADPRFDDLIDFLKSCDFSPAVNQLERHLSALVLDLGVTKEQLHIGRGSDEVPLLGLRRHLERERGIPEQCRLTIVGADSVHSTVRETVRGGHAIVEHTHETVARLRVLGPDLPTRLGRVDQYRISKVLGSIVDYRLNPNGFAEVDVFLPALHHQRLEALRATPKRPVALHRALVRGLNAPLFERLVEHFRHGLTPHLTEVELQSTFRLEHRYIERVVYEDRAQKAHVFLVGDAAISLPFFRGTACLVRCVHSLARAHFDLVHTAIPPGRDEPLASVGLRRAQQDSTELLNPAVRYEREVSEIRKSELATVTARSRLVRGAREFARISSLLPFPLQTWFLSIPDDNPQAGRMSAGAALNILVAVSAGALAIAGSLLDPIFGWWAVLTQAAGGVTYRAAQELEPVPDTLLRRVWLIQIIALFLLGSTLTLMSSYEAGRISNVGPASLWLLLGYVFIAGMLVYDSLGRRWFSRARLESEDV